MPSDRRRICRTISALLAALVLLVAVSFYFNYREIRKTFTADISDRATLFLGQRVDIGDLSFSRSGKIFLKDIRIQNPGYFAQGELLRIKELTLDAEPGELVHGRLHLRSVVLDSPALTIEKNAGGRLNISDRLLRFLSERSGLTFTVDSLRINSGSIDVKGSAEGRTEKIDLEVSNISSARGTKSILTGSAAYSGNVLEYRGWAYIADAPKRFSLSITARDFAPPGAFRDLLAGYGIDAGKTRADMDLTAEGDTEKGTYISSEVRLRRTGFSFLQREVGDILINARAFLDLHKDSLVIDEIVLHSEADSSVRIKGTVTDMKKTPLYRGTIQTDRFDLSLVRPGKSVRLRGSVSADKIDIKGAFGSGMPYVSGSLMLRDAAIVIPGIDVEKIQATIRVLFDKEGSLQAEATAEIRKAGGYIFRRSPGVRASLDIQGKGNRTDILSSVAVSQFEAVPEGGKPLIADSINFTIDGSVRGSSFSGQNRLDIKGLGYDGQKIQRLQGTFGMDLGKDLLVLKGLSLGADGLTAASGPIRIEMFDDMKRYKVDMQDLNADYPEKAAGLQGLTMTSDIDTAGRSVAAGMSFSAGKLRYRGIEAGAIAGTGIIEKKDFHVVISSASFAGGSLKGKAEGKTSEGFFPLKIAAEAENMDAAILSAAASDFAAIPYALTGNIKRISFDGTLNSQDSAQGNASFEAVKIAALRRDTKKVLLKDISAKAGITFSGKEVEFRADAVVGKTAAKIDGSVKDFATSDRVLKIEAALPETMAADIRESLWDVFPDSLLYAGLHGALSSELSVDYRKAVQTIKGYLKVKDVVVTGENSEYSIGPANGTIPVNYDSAGPSDEASEIPSFAYTDFEHLSKYYSERKTAAGASILRIASLRYGFRLLDDITLHLKQAGRVLKADHFSANIFGGRLNGSAVVDIRDRPGYRAGFIVEGLSMRKLCDDIEPIRGYISGRINGIAYIRGTGAGISDLIGRGDFWAYSSEDEKTSISKEFLQKIGGPSLKAYMRDRSFNKGLVGLYLQDGFIIFRDLEISNRNFLGMTDLSVKVAPLNNRISVDHLMWTITEAAQRAAKE